MSPFETQPNTDSPWKAHLLKLQGAVDELTPEDNAQLDRSFRLVKRRIDNALHAFLSNLPPTILPAYAHDLGCLARPYLTILQNSKLFPRTTTVLCEHLPVIPVPSIPKPDPFGRPGKPTTSATAGTAAVSEFIDEMMRIAGDLSPDESKYLNAFVDHLLSELARRLSPERVNAWLTDPGQLGAIMRSAFTFFTSTAPYPCTADALAPYVTASTQGARAS